jgi:hypothetical protein
MIRYPSLAVAAALALVSVATPASAQSQEPPQMNAPRARADPQGPTRDERIRWFVDSSVGPQSLGAGVISSAWGTALNKPKEYHGTWEGFGKRYAVRSSGVVLGNGIEAGLGAAWGEDPRYDRATSDDFWQRTRHAGQMTIMARGPHGTLRPAYARYAGIVGENAITSAWRADSEQSVGSVLTRSAVGIAGRFISNVFQEFWPDIRKRVF